MKENIYKIVYKNGNTLITKAVGLKLENGLLYQACKQYPFDNVLQSVLDGSKIEKILLLERNNNFC